MDTEIVNSKRLQMLRDLSGGENDLIEEMMDSFVTFARGELDAIVGLNDPVQIRLLREKIHNLKGASLNLGLDQFSEELNNFQEDIKKEIYDRFTEHLEMLNRAFNAIEEFLRTLK